MSTTDDEAPRAAVPGNASPLPKDSSTTGAGQTAAVHAQEATSETTDTLSPAVRRLIRQFDLDVGSIAGTGPDGRIRVGDVMGLLSGRTDSGKRDAPPRIAAHDEGGSRRADEPEARPSPETPAPLRSASAAAPHSSVPTSSIFDCDFSRVLSQRRRLHREGSEPPTTTSYVLTALASALAATPELATDTLLRFGVLIATPEGELRRSLVDVPSPLPEALEDCARAFDAELHANLGADLAEANLLVHAYGESGSLLATPTPIGVGHAASIGIGRVRREVVVRLIDGVETPRIAARCYLSVSFFDDRIAFHRANRALADTVRILESWPD